MYKKILLFLAVFSLISVYPVLSLAKDKAEVYSIGDGAAVYNSYGLDNRDSVYIEENGISDLDAPFGTQLTAEGNTLTATDLLGNLDDKSYSILDVKPTVSKVSVYKGSSRIYKIESGKITFKRSVLDENVSIFAHYGSDKKVKSVKMGNSAEFDCEEGDTVKSFVFYDIGSIKPMKINAYINSTGIYDNDGYEAEE